MGAGLKRARAAAKATRTKAPVLTREPTRKELEREALAALVRAGIAAAAQSKAEAAYEVEANSDDDTDEAIARFDAVRHALRPAQRETCAAGAALTKAMRALQGAK